MDLGFAVPHYDFSVPGESPLGWETVVEYARRAEAAGASTLWLSDHLFLDVEKYGGGPGYHGTYEVLVALAALGRELPGPRLGTLVLCEALRPAGVLAKTLASLDRILDGRLDVGIGGGWYEPEYAAIGMALPPPGERLDRLAEAVEILKGVLPGGPFTFEGEHHTVRDAVALPPAVQQPRPRVFLGGKGNRLLRLVAEGADGWNTVWVWTPESYRERLDVLERACEEVGRDPATVWRTLGLYTLVGEDEADLERRFARMQAEAPGGMLDGLTLDQWREGRLVGTVEQVHDQVAAWAQLGVDQLIACPGPLPFSVSGLDEVDLVGEAFAA